MKSDDGIMVDLKLKGIEIDFETADSIVLASMRDQYYSIKKDIEIIKNMDDQSEWQKEDLEYNENFLLAVVAIIKHYATYSEWPEELKGENDDRLV